MNVVSDLAEILVDRQVHGHRAPVVVLANDAWTAEPNRSDGDIIARNENVWDRDPDAGDNYLSELIAQRYLTTVILLGASNSAERALVRRVKPGNYLRLVRGEHSDDYLERALLFDEPKTRLIKLRGDIIGRSVGHLKPGWQLPSGLRNSLRIMVRSADLIWVGPFVLGSDADTIIRSDASVIWWVTEKSLENGFPAKDQMRNVRVIEGPGAAYDQLFRDLALQVSRLALKPIKRESIRRINEQVHSRVPADITYSDQLIQRLAHQIRVECEEWQQRTLLVYIHDPAAPGGSEVEKRIHRYLHAQNGAQPDSMQLKVAGAAIRWIDRHATMQSPADPKKDYNKVIIIDSISFTGRTLELAANQVRAVWPSADIYFAVLVAFQDLAKSPSLAALPANHLIKATTTDRHDIFFPWGWTQATSSIIRQLKLYDRTQDITVTQRPWGTVELMADQVQCSVRLLSIRAGHRLSYQSHSMRDAVFVAMDSEVGFEFDSEADNVIDAVLLSEGEYIAVPRGVRYRFAAYRNTVRLLEISFGLYDQVFDIERFSDDYGRVGKLGDI